MPMVYWNTAGTATVELTIRRNPAEIVKITLQGCFVKKEANVRRFVERYIDRSADRNKYERSDYLFYCCVSDFREVVTRAVIYYEKPSTGRGWSGPTQKTKTCTVNDPFIITFGEHFFLCCDSEDLKKSRFLAENSKEVRINQALDNRNEFFGLGIDASYLVFISFKTQFQNHIYKVNDQRDLNKLRETGPLLLKDKKTMVGCYRKLPEDQRIEIKIFGNQENSASSAIGHSEDRSQVSLSLSLPGDPSTAPSSTYPAPVPSQPGHGGGPAPDSLPSGAPERDQVPDQAFPGPSRENQDLDTVSFQYNQLIADTIKYLNEYITRRGSLAELKIRFRGSLSRLTGNKQQEIDDVPKLVSALEDLGDIGANKVKLLKLLSKELGLDELKRKVQKFEAFSKQKVTPGLVCLKVVLSVSGNKLALLDEGLFSIYGIDPEELENLQPLKEIRAIIKALLRGSVVFVLEITSLSSLKRLWQSYKDGSFKEKLKKAFNEMEKLKELSQGEEIDVEVMIDEEEYREGLWDLIQLELKGESVKTIERRQRRHSASCKGDFTEEMIVDTVKDAAMKNTKSGRRHSAPSLCCERDVLPEDEKEHVSQKQEQVSRPAMTKEKPESKMNRIDELDKYLYALGINQWKQTTLDISHNFVQDDGLKFLSEALATNECKLTRLDISHNFVKGDGLKYLSEALATNECKLTTLDISHNFVHGDGVKYLSEALATNECKLTTLDLSHNYVDDDGVKYLSEALATNECKLATLDISRNGINGNGLTYLSEALATNECKLTTLDISRNDIDGNGVKYLSGALATNECKLTTLNIGGNRIRSDGVKHLCKALAQKKCKLTTLDISGNGIHGDGVKYLSEALATNEWKLTTLDLSNNYVHDVGLKYLSEALATNECKLTTLDLSNNYIHDDGLKYLSDALATNECKLTTLDLSNNYIHDDGLKYLSDALATNECKLTTLNIGGNRIRSDGVKYLCKALARKKCKLTTLDISRNGIKGDGLKYLSEALGTNECKLTTLNISRNLIRADGLKYLSDPLATKECKLTALDIIGNRIRDQKHDVSIFCSRHDERWVKEELIPLLEMKNGFRCFTQFRDFQPYEMIHDLDDIFYKSRKNIVVVSEYFVHDGFYKYKLLKALESSQDLEVDSFIVIDLDGVSRVYELPRAFRTISSLDVIYPKENKTWRNWLVEQIKETPPLKAMPVLKMAPHVC